MSQKACSEKSVKHESAHLHVAGEAVFVDDIAELSGTLYAALYPSPQAHARILSMDLSAVAAAQGVVATFTAEDIPGSNNCGPILHDDVILADGVVNYIGQPVFMVVADSYLNARNAVLLANIEYEPLPAVLSVREADRLQQYVIPEMRLTSAGIDEAMRQADCRLKGQLALGGQEHFYLEGQVAYAIPKEDGCLQIYSSTQHPSEMQQLVAHMLQRDASQVLVEIRRMGGGFGGKESQSALFCCAAALAAAKLNRPVKCRLDRDDDMLMTGKRHHFEFDYEVAYDRQGGLKALSLDMLVGAGCTADLSGPVATRAVCHVDNAYFLEQVDISARCCKTNTQSNTAFRGFGGPQGAFATEYVIDNIARELGMDALDVRKQNFYGTESRNVTPYGQLVEDNVIHQLVSQLEASSDYRNRRQQVIDFNKTSLVIKKGIAFTPVKFGISFNVVHFNQAGALVHVYTDGSVLVNHGGTEMGQGLNTKVAQVVAGELGISIKRVRAAATDTSKVANTSATAASTGSDLNGKAAQNAAQQIRQRLTDFISEQYLVSPEQITFGADRVVFADQSLSFDDLVMLAYQSRVQLWSDGFYKTPGLSWDKDSLTGSPFYYYAYGASVSEVAIDSLTGESVLLRVDLLHDAGNSINPALDKGQVEGAYIQGMGWLTSEQLVWNDSGRLTTHAPSTYKIPSAADVPTTFNVSLFENSNVKDTILRSKAVGEPPLLLGFSAFFAIRDAIASVADYRINPPLNAPATAEAILNAVDYCQDVNNG